MFCMQQACFIRNKRPHPMKRLNEVEQRAIRTTQFLWYC